MGRVGPIAQWEGMVVDPIGATLAVLVFDAHRTRSGLGLRHSAYEPAVGLLLTVLAGILCGTAAA